MSARGFVILSLPRSGSTSLARMLNEHEDIRCLIEPFHPLRYDGRFHAAALRESPGAALHAIWTRWNGIKHVWEADGWPFKANPDLNQQFLQDSVQAVILLVRRNYLRRIVSNLLSRRTDFWIGTRLEFLERLERVRLPPMDAALIRRQVQRDRQAIAERLAWLNEQNVPVKTLFYEDLFCEDADTQARLHAVNDILAFLGFRSITEEILAESWQSYFDPDTYRWTNADVYHRIPGIERVELELGCDETGWLFR